MAVTIKGQRWKVYAYADYTAYVLADGEMGVFTGVDNFESPNVFVIGDGVSTVAELVAMRQSRPVYAYGDVSSDIPEAGTQVALTGAPDTELYIVVVTGDGTHTIAQLVANFNGNLVNIASIGGVVEIDADYTVEPGVRVIKVVGDAEIDVTIPDTLPVDTPLTFLRTVSSANAVTAVRSGAELIEGAASFVVIGAKAAAAYDPSEVTLRKVASGKWRFVAGVITGSTENGTYEKYPNHRLEQTTSFDIDMTYLSENAIGAYYWPYYRVKPNAEWIYPVQFSTVPKVFGEIDGANYNTVSRAVNKVVLNGKALSSGTRTVYLRAVGTW